MKIGILGAGQLGVMLAESAWNRGHQVIFYDPNPSAPGHARSPASVCAPWTDVKALQDFFGQADVVTYEFENIKIDLLDYVQSTSQKPVYPSIEVLEMTQNRKMEKEFLKVHGLPSAWWCYFATASDLKIAQSALSWPKNVVFKTATGGYDGKGQWVLRGLADRHAFVEQMQKSPSLFPLVAEELLPLKTEVSCIVGRSQSGQCVVFPVFENYHSKQILDTTLMPAYGISEKVQEKIREISTICAHKLGLVGLLTTEFFICDGGHEAWASKGRGVSCDGVEIFVNEFAPRPHNSGHVTRGGCQVSQFDVHVEAITGLSLTQPKLLFPGETSAMGNLLGEIFMAQDVKNGVLPLNGIYDQADVLNVLLYGKTEAQVGRKMGHFVLKSRDPEHAMQCVQKVRTYLSQAK